MSNRMSSIASQLIDVPLLYASEKYCDVFKRNNNKTLGETIVTPTYNTLANYATKYYFNELDTRLGDFLFQIKNTGDMFYKEFLNTYGDLEYSIFSLKDKQHYNLKGVYFYYLDHELKYIGRCRDSMQKRINNGYGSISPKNCFKDGQSTNCKLNALITKYKDKIDLKIFSMNNEKEIEVLESMLIAERTPEWNFRK